MVKVEEVDVSTVSASDERDDQPPDPETQSTTGVADDDDEEESTGMAGDEEPVSSNESEDESDDKADDKSDDKANDKADDKADDEEQHPIRTRSGSELESTQDDNYVNTSVDVASDHLGGDQSDQKVLPSSSSSLLGENSAKDVKTKKKKGEKQKTEKKEKMKKGDKQKTEKKEKKKRNIDYDSDNELWIGSEQGVSTQNNDHGLSIEKQNNTRSKRIKKFRHKSEWESSVMGDRTTRVFRKSNDDSEIEVGRTSMTSLISLDGSKSLPSFTFRSLKELRSTSVRRLMTLDDSRDASMSNSVSSEASDGSNSSHRKPTSTQDLLRKDLEAQARARVEKSFNNNESLNLSFVFDGFQVRHGVGSSAIEEESKNSDDEKNNDAERGDGDGEEDGKHKTGRLQK
jgi:hypothetical protein